MAREILDNFDASIANMRIGQKQVVEPPPAAGAQPVAAPAQPNTLQEGIAKARAKRVKSQEPATPEAKAEVGPFGPILTQYHHDAQGAIQALTQLQDGEAVAALYHPDVGDIDLAWGKTSENPRAKGFGLAKLVRWHPEVLGDLQGFIASLSVKQRHHNKIHLFSKEGDRGSVQIDWDGKTKTWLLTAYTKGVGSGTSADTASNDFKGDTARLEPDSDSSLAQTAPPAQAATENVANISTKEGAAKAQEAAQDENKGADPAAVPNFPEPASSARDDVSAPSSSSVPPSATAAQPIFSQGLLSPKGLGPKPTPKQVERYVEQIKEIAKTQLPISVVSNPSEIRGVNVPVGAKPTGALIEGKIYIFSDNIMSRGDAYSTIFHEIFHLGLQNVIPAEDYATLLRQFTNNVLVQKYVRQWKSSPEGVARELSMPSAAYEALAAEEAMALIAEDLHVKDGVGRKKMSGLIKSLLSWFANVADRINLSPRFSNWIRDLTRDDAEKFVSDMVRAAMGGAENLARTQVKYRPTGAEMTAQTRLSAGSDVDANPNQSEPRSFDLSKRKRSNSPPISDENKAVMRAIATGKSTRDVLRLIAKQSKNPLYRSVARGLLKSGITPEIWLGHIPNDKKGRIVLGEYDSVTDTISIAAAARHDAEHVFLHEAMHAATVLALRKMGWHATQLHHLYKHVKGQHGLSESQFYGQHRHNAISTGEATSASPPPYPNQRHPRGFESSLWLAVGRPASPWTGHANPEPRTSH